MTGATDRNWLAVPSKPHAREVYITRDQTGTVSSRPHLPAAEIRYTLDGSEPTRESPLYPEPISPPDGGLVAVRAYDEETTVALKRGNHAFRLEHTHGKSFVGCAVIAGIIRLRDSVRHIPLFLDNQPYSDVEYLLMRLVGSSEGCGRPARQVVPGAAA